MDQTICLAYRPRLLPSTRSVYSLLGSWKPALILYVCFTQHCHLPLRINRLSLAIGYCYVTVHAYCDCLPILPP